MFVHFVERNSHHCWPECAGHFVLNARKQTRSLVCAFKVKSSRCLPACNRPPTNNRRNHKLIFRLFLLKALFPGLIHWCAAGGLRIKIRKISFGTEGENSHRLSVVIHFTPRRSSEAHRMPWPLLICQTWRIEICSCHSETVLDINDSNQTR